MSAQAFDHSEHVVLMNRFSFHSNVAGGEVLRQAHDTVETCPCNDGCDKCKSISKISSFILVTDRRDQAFTALLARKEMSLPQRSGRS